MKMPKKILIEIDEGVYVDPHQIASLRSVSYGRRGVVRVSLLNGDHFDVREHDTENGRDPSQAVALLEHIVDQVAEANP